jgi:hypothetical protein
VSARIVGEVRIELGANNQDCHPVGAFYAAGSSIVSGAPEDGFAASPGPGCHAGAFSNLNDRGFLQTKVYQNAESNATEEGSHPERLMTLKNVAPQMRMWPARQIFLTLNK